MTQEHKKKLKKIKKRKSSDRMSSQKKIPVVHREYYRVYLELYNYIIIIVIIIIYVIFFKQ